MHALNPAQLPAYPPCSWIILIHQLNAHDAGSKVILLIECWFSDFYMDLTSTLFDILTANSKKVTELKNL